MEGKSRGNGRSEVVCVLAEMVVDKQIKVLKQLNHLVKVNSKREN